MSQRTHSISPPGGAPILRSMLADRAPKDAADRLRSALAARLACHKHASASDTASDPRRVTLHRSGREALRVALAQLAGHSGRNEVIVPAYTCYSVPAAALAAGLKVRLVEVDPYGRIDPNALSKLPLERAAAIIVCNLFGHCEPIRSWSHLAEEAGVAIIDDAAQALGASGPEGAAGARGTLGILSFGRGKPLAALGGGACVWHNIRNLSAANATTSDSAIRPSAIRALAAALFHDAALQPKVFQQLKRISFLGIGETHFDPDFARGEIEPHCLALAHAQLARLDADAEQRRQSAAKLIPLLQSAGYTPLASLPIDRAHHDISVYPRLAVRAPSESLRERAVDQLARFGAGRLYPEAVSGVSGLQSARVESDHFPVATELASQLFTMRTTRGYSQSDQDQIAGVLEAKRV